MGKEEEEGEGSRREGWRVGRKEEEGRSRRERKKKGAGKKEARYNRERVWRGGEEELPLNVAGAQKFPSLSPGSSLVCPHPPTHFPHES